MYIAIKELPQSLQNLLSSLGYHKTDIEVKSQERYTVNPGTAFEGNRGFTAAVNLDTGKSVSISGSWGGANPFETNTIDHSLESPPILSNMAVVQGESGGRGTFVRVFVHPDTLAKLLPDPSTALTDEQGVVLHVLKGYKSFARRREAESFGVSSLMYDWSVSELADLGFAKVSSNGATQITTAGKNALSSFKLPKRKGW